MPSWIVTPQTTLIITAVVFLMYLVFFAAFIICMWLNPWNLCLRISNLRCGHGRGQGHGGGGDGCGDGGGCGGGDGG